MKNVFIFCAIGVIFNERGQIGDMIAITMIQFGIFNMYGVDYNNQRECQIYQKGIRISVFKIQCVGFSSI